MILTLKPHGRKQHGQGSREAWEAPKEHLDLEIDWTHVGEISQFDSTARWPGFESCSTTDKLCNLQPSFNLFMLQGFFICSSGDDTLMGLEVFMRIK